MIDRHVRVRWIAHVTKAAAVAVILLLPFTSGLAHAQTTEYRCETSVTFENQVRRVFGTNIQAECGCPDECQHSVPFGNWGVNSNGGTIQNSFQFPGWKKQCSFGFYCDLLQWNSCTRDHTPTDYPEYYTGNGYTQVPKPDGRAVHGGWTDQGAGGVTCKNGGAVGSFRGNYMDLWELDSDGNDLVAELIYPSVNIPLTCDTDWDCHGSSGWLSPSRGADVVSADIRITVYTYRVICNNAENDECF